MKVEIRQIRGGALAQAEGTIGSEPFYFRRLGGLWVIGVGSKRGDLIGHPAWEHEQRYAGRMARGEVLEFIRQAAVRYCADAGSSR